MFNMIKVLILGAKGMLGGELLRVFGSEAIGLDRNDIDATDFLKLKEKIQSLKPEIVINCIAYNDVDGAEENFEVAFKLNSELPKNLAEICSQENIILVHFSTNYVFDGKKGEYLETDTPKPLSKYGESKYLGEQNILNNWQKFYIVRTSVLFGKKGESELSKKSFVELMLGLSEKQETIKVVSDEINSLTYVTDLAHSVKNLLFQMPEFGIYHLVNSREASWYDFAKEIFQIKNKHINLEAVSRADFPRKAKTPSKAVLINTKLPALRPWQESLKEFLSAN
jgi:dTDP-4-dehydrorhamnose reductase